MAETYLSKQIISARGVIDNDGTPRGILMESNDSQVVSILGADGNPIATKHETDGAYSTVKQDNYAPAIIAHFNQVTNSTTLSVAAVQFAYTITVTDTTGFVDDKYIVLFDVVSNRFSTFHQIGAPAGNVITLDTQIDFAYPIGTFVDSSIVNMNVDGSVTPQIFGLRGLGVAPGVSLAFDLTRIIFYCITDTAVNLVKFGDLAALTRGLCLRERTTGATYNIFNVKSNGEIAGIMLDWYPYASGLGSQAVNGFSARLTFNGDEKLGVVKRLRPGEDLEFIIQDDLTDIISLQVVAEGHQVTD